MIEKIKKVGQLKKEQIIFNNIIERKEDEPYEEYYYIQDFIYDDDDNYDLFLQKCWGNYQIVQKSEKNFQYKRYSVLEKKDDEHDKILQILENSNIRKEELDEVILRTKKNAGGNSFKSQYKNKWIPLKLSQDVTIEYGQRVELPLGITIRVPKKYEAWVYLYDTMYDNFGIIQEAPLILDNEHSSLNDWKVPVILLNPKFVRYDAVNVYGHHYGGGRSVDDTKNVRFNEEITIPKGTLVAKMRLIDLNTNIIIRDQVPVEEISEEERLDKLVEWDESDEESTSPLTEEDDTELDELEASGYSESSDDLPDDEEETEYSESEEEYSEDDE